jgi:hypothetical protein
VAPTRVALPIVLAAQIVAATVLPTQPADARAGRFPRAVAALYQDAALRLRFARRPITYSGASDGSHRIRVHLHPRERTPPRLSDVGRPARPHPIAARRSTRGATTCPAYSRERVPILPFVFRADRQPLHRRFFNLGEDEALGRKAFKVGPIQPKGRIKIGENDWVGNRVVSTARRASFLKVEAWSPADWDKRAKREQELADARSKKSSWESDVYDFETIKVEFGIVKNGMRFPSKVTIVRTESKVLGGEREFQTSEHEILRVTAGILGYEFFSVRSSEEILRSFPGTVYDGDR